MVSFRSCVCFTTFRNSLVLKQNAIVGLMQTVQRNDNKLKMLHSTFMGYQMLLTWDPDGMIHPSLHHSITL